ncbi:MAG: hypothetical protein AAFY33_00780 [Cyanobacteria bacterium J06643_4]
MAANQPLKGIALIDCAKANAPQGADVAANLCGYGEDVSSFRQALIQAGEEAGITLTGVDDLIIEPTVASLSDPQSMNG